MKPTFVLLTFLLGCKMGEEHFQDELIQRSCRVGYACGEDEDENVKFNFETEEECREYLEGYYRLAGDDANCEYDPKAARDCLQAVDEMDCDELNAEIPECEDVYSDECDTTVDD